MAKSPVQSFVSGLVAMLGGAIVVTVAFRMGMPASVSQRLPFQLGKLPRSLAKSPLVLWACSWTNLLMPEANPSAGSLS